MCDIKYFEILLDEKINKPNKSKELKNNKFFRFCSIFYVLSDVKNKIIIQNSKN